MLIVSDKNDGSIVSFMSSRQLGVIDTDMMLKKMFPGRDDLQCNFIDVPNIDVSNCKIETDHGIVSAIYSAGKEVFRIDPGILREMVKKKVAEEKEKLLAKVPVAVDHHLKRIFDSHVYRISKDHVAESIEDGSYFSSDIMVAGWWGSFLDAGGYANMNREITQRLHRYGVIPIVDIYPTIVQVGNDVEQVFRDYSKIKPKNDSYPYVYAFTPMPHRRHGGKRIFFTMMETSTLHPDFAKYCNEYSDEIWVPSSENRRVFLENSVKKKIKVVPLGIDENLYFGTETDRSAIDIGKCAHLYGRHPEDGVGSYKFLSVIQWNIRKGYDALIKSFFNAFDKDDDVCLVISTQYSKDLVKGCLDNYVSDGPDAPQVLLYNSVIPVDRMPYIYDACDCYVHMSRGEGFSLTQIEAGARGLPVISCFHSGMTEYMTDDNSYKIECNSDSPCSAELNAISCYYSGQRMWDVGAPQIDQAVDYMRHVVSHPEEAKERAERMKSLIFHRFTWEKTAKRVSESLKL